MNKVNTKATVRCSVQSGWIPLWAHDALKKSVRGFSHSSVLWTKDQGVCV